MWSYADEKLSEQVHAEYFLFQRRMYQNEPIVNCTRPIQNRYEPYYSCDITYEAAILGACSFLLTLVNIVCIIIMALIILRIKEVVPLHQTNEAIQEFFKHDVKMIRDRNRLSLTGQNRENGKDFTLSSEQDDGQSVDMREANSGAITTTRINLDDLQMYVKDFGLDIFNTKDRELLTRESEEKVSCFLK